jgi:hypothetical protein
VGGLALAALIGCGDPAWTRHPGAAALIDPQPFPLAGPDAWFALHRRWSDLDRDPEGLRPYVFRIDAEGRLIEVWRGSALGWPLVSADVTSTGLCAVHRDDDFLAPNPSTRGRRTAAWRWNGFGFAADGECVR